MCSRRCVVFRQYGWQSLSILAPQIQIGGNGSAKCAAIQPGLVTAAGGFTISRNRHRRAGATAGGVSPGRW